MGKVTKDARVYPYGQQVKACRNKENLTPDEPENVLTLIWASPTNYIFENMTFI